MTAGIVAVLLALAFALPLTVGAVGLTASTTTLTLTPVTYGTDPTLTANLKETATNTALVGRTISFLLNGVTVTGTTGAGGNVSVVYTTPLNAGSYPVTATYAGDGSYASSSSSASLTVNPAGTTLMVTTPVSTPYGTNPTLTASLKESVNTTALSGKTVSFEVNGTTVTGTTDVSGNVSVVYTAPLDAAPYPINATYGGETNYAAATHPGTLYVTPLSTSMTLTPANQTITYGQPAPITATLTAGGNPVAGKTITFRANATTRCTVTTDAAGQATCDPTPLIGGNLTVAAYFAGEMNYVGFNKSVDLTVNPADSTLTVNAVAPVTYGTYPTLTANLKENVNHAGVSGKTITFDVNGQLVTGTTNATGNVSVVYTGPLSPGTYPVTATFAADITYNASSDSTKSAVVDKANTTLTAADVTTTYGVNPTLTANLKESVNGTAVSGQTISFVVNGQTVTGTTDASGNASVVYASALVAGNYGISAAFAGDPNYMSSNGTGMLNVNRADTTVAVSAIDPVFYGGNPVIQVYVTENVHHSTLNGRSVDVTINGYTDTGTTNSSGVATVIYGGPALRADIYVVTSSFAGDANYNASSGFQWAVVDMANQTITFGPLGLATFGDLPFTVSASATSGLPVSFTAAGACSVSGTTVTITAAGDCTVTAVQWGDDNYNRATSVDQSFTVAKANQTITFAPLAGATFGDAPFMVGATASSTLPVSFSTTGACSVSVTTVTITAAGTCTVTADQAGNGNYNPAAGVGQSFNIAKAPATMVLNGLIQTYDGMPKSVTATTVPPDLTGITFTYNSSTQAPTDAGAYPVQAVLTNNNYTGTASGTLTIDPAGQTISFDALPGKTFGDAPFQVTAYADSNLSVTFTATEPCSVTGDMITITAPGICTVTAAQAGSNNYLPAPSVPQSFTVAKAGTTLTVTTPVSTPYLTNPTLTAHLKENVNNTALSGQTISFVVNGQTVTVTATTDAAGNVSVPYTFPLNGGSYQITATFTGDAYNATTTGTGTLNVTPLATSMTLNPATQSITYGQPATLTATLTSGLSQVAHKTITIKQGATTLCIGPTNATGQVTCKPTTLPGGLSTVTATFTSDTNYVTSTANATVDVAKADQTITFNALTGKTFGQAPFPVNATADSELQVSFTATGACSVTGNTVTITGAGTCTVTADQAGDGNYNPALGVSQVFLVDKAPATLSLSGLSPTYDGFSKLVTVTTVPADLGGVILTYDGIAPAPVNAGSYAIVASLLNPNYTAADVTGTLVVAKATQTMTLTPSSQTVSDGQVTLTATLTPHVAGQSITFTQGATTLCTIAADAAGQAVCHPTGLTGTGLIVTANFAGSLNYNPSSATATVTIVPPAPPSPPPAPAFVTISAPVTLTRSDSITVTGTANAGFTVQVNGTAIQASSAGTWSTVVTLKEGPNVITATNGTTTASATVVRDSTPPILTLIASATETTEATVTLSAASEAGALVTIEGHAGSTFTAALALGRNTFTATASDQAGNQSTATVTVVRVAPATVTMDPLPGTVTADLLNVSGSATAGTEVKLMVNGVAQQAVTVDATGRFAMKATLSTGNNRIYVKGAGTLASDEATVSYQPPIVLTDVAGHWAEPAIMRMVQRGVVKGYDDKSFRPQNDVSRLEFAVMLSRALNLAPAGDALGFSDAAMIPTWGSGQLAALVKVGIIKGRADGTFRPNDTVTRAEVAVMLERTLAYLGRTANPSTTVFVDADQIPAWAALSIRTVAGAGLMQGSPDGRFGPGNHTTRAESAAILDRLLAEPQR